MEGHCTILSFSFSIQKKLQVVSSPSKPVVVSSNHVVVAANSSANVGATVENRGVKRGADIDFEAFSDAKRRKTNEKGGKGETLWQRRAVGWCRGQATRLAIGGPGFESITICLK